MPNTEKEVAEKCSLCLQCPQIRPVLLNCDHSICGTCAGEHVFKSRRVGVVSCPLCRGLIKKIRSPTEDKNSVSFQYSGINWTIDVNLGNETVEERISKLLHIPSERIRIFGRGGKQINNFDLLLEKTSGAKFRLLGTPVDESFGKEHYLMVKGKILLSRTRSFIQEWVIWLISILFLIIEYLLLFFQTLSPFTSYRNEHNERIRERERERHRAMNRAMN